MLGVGHRPSLAQLRPSKSYRLRTGERQVSTLGVGAPSPGEFGGKVGGKSRARCARFLSIPEAARVIGGLLENPYS